MIATTGVSTQTPKPTSLSDIAPGPIVDRTTSLLNAMTPAQRYHSRLFSEYQTSGRILDTLMGISINYEPEDFPSGTDQTLREYMKQEACSIADAAFEGTVVIAASHPIDDGTFLFTDYTIQVTDPYRMPVNSGLSRSSTVIVGRPGGELTVEGQLIKARVNTDPPLIVGTTYIVFAHYHAGFKVFDSSIRYFPTFVVTADHKARVLAPEEFRPLSDLPRSSEGMDVAYERLTSVIKSVVSSCR
jgi:hypothetical protein